MLLARGWTIEKVNSPVWIVMADNLDTGPFIDGVNTYHIVVSFKSKKVEDVYLI